MAIDVVGLEDLGDLGPSGAAGQHGQHHVVGHGSQHTPWPRLVERARARRSVTSAAIATPRPRRVTSAATQLIAGRPSPAAITRPPRAAPAALPRLNAAMLAAEATVGASWAAAMIRVCRTGTIAKAASPKQKTATVAATWS